MSEIVLVNLAIALASVVQAAAGLGFAMVATPLIGLVNLAFLPGPMLFANIFLSIAVVLRDGAALDRREAGPLGLGLLIGTAIGAGFLTLIPVDRLGVVFGVLILAAVVLSLVSPRVALTRPNVLAGSAGAGFTGIVAGMHAPPLVMLYQREAPSKIRATFAAVFIFGSSLALVGLALAGRFGGAELWMGVSLLPGIVGGYAVGWMLSTRVTQGRARVAMLTISGLGGVMLLVKSL